MADVRVLLRSERASRRITHPYAAYSSSGQLSCSLCHSSIKSETLWDSHVRSAGHVAALKQAQKTQVESNNRKRKAAEEETHHVRKKSRSGREGVQDVPDEGQAEVDVAEEGTTAPVLEGFVREQQPRKSAVLAPNVDEDEWAAFERDIAIVPDEKPLARPIISSGAVISAQPVTAEELRAQAQKEDTARRQQRQVEVEAEKEDATRALEDEFEEMEALEQRVRRLREQREALRSAKGLSHVVKEQPAVKEAHAEQQTTGEAPEDDDEDEEDDEDEWSMWRK